MSRQKVAIPMPKSGNKAIAKVLTLLLSVALIFCVVAFVACENDSGLAEKPEHEAVSPTEPSESTDTDPTDPSESTDTDSTDPTDPSESTDSTDPTDPSESTDPTDPTEPDDGENEDLHSPTEVRVCFWRTDSAHDEWIIAAADAFNQIQDKYRITVKFSVDSGAILASLASGGANSFDLYFGGIDLFESNPFYNDILPLDDLIATNVWGEEKTIGEKIDPAILETLVGRDGTTRMLAYDTEYFGIVYNSAIIDGEKYKVPRTTDELTALTFNLSSDPLLRGDGVSPWLFFTSGNGYWDTMLSVWAAQYDGADYYYNTLLPLGGTDIPSKEIYTKKDGRYQALKALEQFITPETSHEACMYNDFVNIQFRFLSGKSAFLLSGSWLLTEMQEFGPMPATENARMMKTPVISSIVDTLEDTSMTDATLAEIIDAVDRGATSSPLCSANDFARIKAARNYVYTNSRNHLAYIPKCVSEENGAKEFLKYLYSDAGTLVYMNSTHLPAPASLTDESKFDLTSLTEWEKRIYALGHSAIPIVPAQNQADIISNYGLLARVDFAVRFCTMNPVYRMDADACWELFVGQVDRSWDDWTNHAPDIPIAGEHALPPATDSLTNDLREKPRFFGDNA